MEILERLSIIHGPPAILRMDNGPGLTSKALADGVVGLVFIPPGEPWRNGYVESFHSRQREEFLNINTFNHCAASTRRAHRLAPRVQLRPQALKPGLQDPHRIR